MAKGWLAAMFVVANRNPVTLRNIEDLFARIFVRYNFVNASLNNKRRRIDR